MKKKLQYDNARSSSFNVPQPCFPNVYLTPSFQFILIESESIYINRWTIVWIRKHGSRQCSREVLNKSTLHFNSPLILVGVTVAMSVFCVAKCPLVVYKLDYLHIRTNYGWRWFVFDRESADEWAVSTSDKQSRSKIAGRTPWEDPLQPPAPHANRQTLYYIPSCLV